MSKLTHIVNVVSLAMAGFFWYLLDSIARVRECMVMNGLHEHGGVIAFVVDHRMGLFVAAGIISQIFYWGVGALERRARLTPPPGVSHSHGVRCSAVLRTASLAVVGLQAAWWGAIWATVLSELVIAQHGTH